MCYYFDLGHSSLFQAHKNYLKGHVQLGHINRSFFHIFIIFTENLDWGNREQAIGNISTFWLWFYSQSFIWIFFKKINNVKAKAILAMFLYHLFFKGICACRHYSQILPLGNLGSSTEFSKPDSFKFFFFLFSSGKIKLFCDISLPMTYVLKSKYIYST